MTSKKTNFLKLWISDASYSAANALSTGSVFSAFLMRNGLTESQIAMYLSVTQTVNFVVSLLLAGAASAERDTRKPLLWLTAMTAVLTVCHIVFCIWSMQNILIFALVLLLGCLQAVITALRTIYIYKLPCEVIDMRDYTVLTGYQGLFTGIAGIGIGFLLPLFFEKYPYMTVCGAAFAAAGLLQMTSGCCIWKLHPMEKNNSTVQIAEEPTRIKFSVVDDLLRLIRNKDFRWLLVPNILRGAGNAMISIFALLVIQAGILNEENVSLITAATSIASIISCFAYVFCVKHFNIPKTCLIGGILFCFFCLTHTRGSIMCVLMYAIAYIGYNMVSCAIPNMIYRSVSSDLISIFQSWRLALSQLGQVLALALFGMMMETVDGFWIILLTCIVYLAFTVWYYCYFRKHPDFRKGNRETNKE